jgi:hypothetical protein
MTFVIYYIGEEGFAGVGDLEYVFALDVVEGLLVLRILYVT